MQRIFDDNSVYTVEKAQNTVNISALDEKHEFVRQSIQPKLLISNKKLINSLNLYRTYHL